MTVQERSKCLIIPDSLESAESFDENISSEILRRRNISRESQTQSVDAPGVGLKKTEKGCPLAFFCTVHESIRLKRAPPCRRMIGSENCISDHGRIL